MQEVINPVDQIIRTDRLPHMWCSGCGVGIAVNCFARAIEKADLPFDKVAVVSGIGCTGRVAGYINLDSFHTTHGRAIPFATGLKLARPDMRVVVFSGDGDLIAIGGNHFIHAARRNVDLKIICVNNFIYGMTGGQLAPTTPINSIATTSPYGNVEQPFNLPFLADSAGATYVARWTTFHVVQLTKAIAESFQKPGFSFIEILACCPTLYSRRNRLGTGLDMMKFFKEVSETKHGAPTNTVDLDFSKEKPKIIVGKFIERERPIWTEMYNKVNQEKLGKKFIPYSNEGLL